MERRRPAHELRRAIWRSSTIVDLLLTVASLLVAIYAVVPRARQLDLRLRDFSIFGMWNPAPADGARVARVEQPYSALRVAVLMLSALAPPARRKIDVAGS
jgi:hypothetical protein